MTDYGTMPGRYPAIVRSYDQARRTCRIEIPGLTDGADVLPEAEIEYSIGDKSRSGQFETEIEILPGDTVWIAFIGGDPRYPVITGWRNPQTGNSANWRRWHHQNIEHLADSQIKRGAGVSITDEAGKTISVKAGSTITAEAGSSITLKVGGSSIVMNGSSISLNSALINLNGVIAAGGAGGAAATFSGSVTVTGEVKSQGISLPNHVHECPHCGDTGKPK